MASKVLSISHFGGSSIPADEPAMNLKHEERNIQAKHGADASVDHDSRRKKVLDESALENGPALPTQTVSGMKSFNATRPVVCAAVDPFSWLSYEFPMGITRDCPRSQCRVNVDQLHGSTTSTMYSSTNNGSTVLNSCGATVYLTSFTPNEVVLPASLRNHINAAVFMENDPRYIRGEDTSYHRIIRELYFNSMENSEILRCLGTTGNVEFFFSVQHVWRSHALTSAKGCIFEYMRNIQQTFRCNLVILPFFFAGGRHGLALELERTLGSRLSLALGYRPTRPWEVAPGSSAWQVPCRRISYINDPIERFSEWPSYPNISEQYTSKHNHTGMFQSRTGMLPGIAFFSSQCESIRSKARIDLLASLVPALQAEGVWFASFGKCFHNEDFAEMLPECARLPR